MTERENEPKMQSPLYSEVFYQGLNRPIQNQHFLIEMVNKKSISFRESVEACPLDLCLLAHVEGYRDATHHVPRGLP